MNNREQPTKELSMCERAVYNEKTMKQYREATTEQQTQIKALFVQHGLLSEAEARYYNGINKPYEKDTTVKNVVSDILGM